MMRKGCKFLVIGFFCIILAFNSEARRIKSLKSTSATPQIIPVQDYPRLDVPAVQYAAFFNVGKFLGEMTQIPDEVITAIEEKLAEAKDKGEIKGYKLLPVAKDVYIHIATWQKGMFNQEIYNLMRDAVLNGLKVAEENGYLVDRSVLEETDKKAQYQLLEFRATELGETPRKAEPDGVMILEGAAPGVQNFIFYNVYCEPTNNAGSVIDPKMSGGFLFDIEDEKTFVEIDGVRYPKTNTIWTEGERGKEKILALISDPNRFRITKVRKANPDGTPASEEPVAVATLNYFGDEKNPSGSFNTVILYRAQSGLPAAGEYLNALRKSYLLLAGRLQDGVAPHFRPLLPVSLDELRSGSSANFVRVGVYGFQLGREGALPKEILDLTQSSTFDYTREHAQMWAEFLERMRGFIPDLNPDYANKIARDALLANQDRFDIVPEKEPMGEGKNTVSLIKADIGSLHGHIGVSEEVKSAVAQVLKAAKEGGSFRIREFIKKVKTKSGEKVEKEFVEPILKAAQDLGLLSYELVGYEKEDLAVFEVKYKLPLINDFKVFNAGDDTETLLFHRSGIDSPLIHRYVALLAFLKGANVAVDMGLYGAGQDILTEAPSGNVRGAGPGVAEMVIGSNNKPLDIIAMDKTSPMAFNVLGKEMVERAMARSDKEYVVELWWLEKGATKRIFVDAKTEMDLLMKLLPCYDHVAIKRIYEKSRAGWDPANVESYLGDVVAVFSTDKLALTAGEYVGKDDPVAIFNHDFAVLGGLRDSFANPWLVEGGMRGSHRMVLRPSYMGDDLLTINDAPPLAIGLQVGFRSKEGEIAGFQGGEREFNDEIFKGSDWDQVRRKSNQLNFQLLMEQGPFAPFRLSGESAEYTTLPQVLEELANDPSARFEPLPLSVLRYILFGLP